MSKILVLTHLNRYKVVQFIFLNVFLCSFLFETMVLLESAAESKRSISSSLSLFLHTDTKI